MAASEAARVAMAASQAWAVRDAWEATEHAFPQLVPVKKDCKTSLMMRCGAEHESVGEVARALHMAADATMRLQQKRASAWLQGFGEERRQGNLLTCTWGGPEESSESSVRGQSSSRPRST